MFNYIIIENEKLGAGLIKNFFDNVPGFDFKGMFENPYDALQMLKDGEIQLVFINYTLDNNALDFIRSINREVFPLFVIMSDNAELALDSVRVINMIDFILKPVNSSRLNDTLRIIEHAMGLRLAKSVSVEKDYIFVKVDKKKIKIRLDNIYYLESVKDYVRVVTKNKRYLVYKTLTSFTKELDQSKFMRVHRSYTVSLDKIEAIDGFYMEILDKKVPFSRRYHDELKSKLLLSE